MCAVTMDAVAEKPKRKDFGGPLGYRDFCRAMAGWWDERAVVSEKKTIDRAKWHSAQATMLRNQITGAKVKDTEDAGSDD